MIMTKVMKKIDENDPIWQANEAKMKIPKDFPEIPGSKILGNPVPNNPGIPGFGKIPGLKFLIPLGPAHYPLPQPIFLLVYPCLLLAKTLPVVKKP